MKKYFDIDFRFVIINVIEKQSSRVNNSYNQIQKIVIDFKELFRTYTFLCFI